MTACSSCEMAFLNDNLLASPEEGVSSGPQTLNADEESDSTKHGCFMLCGSSV